MSTFIDENPATGEPLAELEDTGADAVDAAVRRAQAAFPGWADMAGRDRARILWRLADLLEAEGEEIAKLESADNGRPIRETAAQASIVSTWYRYFAGWSDKIEGTTIPVGGSHLNYTERIPVGVCGAITPWNHPLVIATKKVAPALATGNVVIVKPSELAPLSVLRLATLAHEAGLPEGVLQVLPGQRQTGEALVVHPGVQRIDVTGSTGTGIAVQRAAAPTMKRLGMELGGKAANMVFDDADIDAAIEGALFGAFIAQGQTCIAGARVLVQASIADAFVERFTARAGAIRVGDPAVGATQMGPQISRAALERIEAFVAGAVDEGAQLLTGGRRPDLDQRLAAGHFYTPTILRTDDPGIRAAQEEIFGPVVTVIPFGDEREAVEIANGVPSGLGAGIWSQSVARAHRVARQLRAGTIWINDYHRVDPASPWGGFGMSGYGRENGREAIDMFTESRSVWVRTAEPAVGWYQSDAAMRLN